MSRQMPPYAASLHQKISEAVALAKAGDLVIATMALDTPLRQEWSIKRIEFLYELSYLRMFVEWERFLEETFLRYLCGYVSTHGACQPATGQHFNKLGVAEAAVLGGRPYALWHNPNTVITRSRNFFVNGFHEVVIASNVARLDHFAAIRHRVVHDQYDAKQSFDLATMNLVGRRYRASRPGRFLRDWDQSGVPTRRWLDTIGTEIAQLARQIA
jgi:hypothetical protein